MRHRTLIIIILSLLLVGGVAAWKFIPHTLSYNECSDVYRHFADMRLPGVRVTYIQDKIINDTLRLPVTLLQAETDEGWEAIDDLFGYSQQIEAILNEPDLPDSVKHEILETLTSFYGYRSNRKMPEKVISASDFSSDDVFVYIFLNMRCVTVYEPFDVKNEYEAVSSRVIKNTSRCQI